MQDALAQKGLECTVFEFSASTRTAIEAAVAIGCEVAQIVKSLVFKTKKIGSAKSSASGKGKLFAGSIASRCDQAGRATVEKNITSMLEPPIINEIIEVLPVEMKNSYLNYDIKTRTTENGDIIPLPNNILIQIYINRIPLDNSKELSVENKRDTNEIELCILQEFILRYFDYIEKNGKRWFLTPIQVLLNKVEKIR